MQGVVKSYDPGTGEGVVVRDTDRSEYALAAGALEGSIFRKLRQGQRVVFELDGSERATRLRTGAPSRTSAWAASSCSNGHPAGSGRVQTLRCAAATIGAVVPLLVTLFIGVPIAELYVLLQVGHAIGVLDTLALLVLVSMVGAWLAKREGIGVLRRMQAALDAGRVPGAELLDGFLILMAAALMLTPASSPTSWPSSSCCRPCGPGCDEVSAGASPAGSASCSGPD